MVAPQVSVLTLAFLLMGVGPVVSTQQSIPPPSLISPAAGAVMDNGCRDQSEEIDWSFDWEDVWGASAYQIKVWRNPEKPVVDDANVTTSEYRDVSKKSHIINTNRTDWCWKVRAKIANEWREWSETRCFEAEPVDTDCP